MNDYSFNGYFVQGGRIINTKEKQNDKYQRILDAAVNVFAEKGFFKATVSQIAKKAGVADGTIYLYFKNKDDILENFLSFKIRQIFKRFREEVEKVDNPIEKLRFLVRKHLEEFQEDRQLAIVYQTEIHRYNRIGEEMIKEMSQMYLDIVTGILEQGQEEGIMRRNLYTGLVKRMISGAVDEVINTWLHSDRPYDLVSMADPLVDLFINGIGCNRQTADDCFNETVTVDR